LTSQCVLRRLLRPAAENFGEALNWDLFVFHFLADDPADGGRNWQMCQLNRANQGVGFANRRYGFAEC
jgi:hypothetical protein